MTTNRTPTLWVLEDTSNHSAREQNRGVGDDGPVPIAVRLYKVRDGQVSTHLEVQYVPGTLRSNGGLPAKTALALELLRRARVREGVVVVARRIANARMFLQVMRRTGLRFIAEIRPELPMLFCANNGKAPVAGTPADRLRSAQWRGVQIDQSEFGASYEAADLGIVSGIGVEGLRCVAVSAGGIDGFSRGLLVGVAFVRANSPVERLAQQLCWVRWARTLIRRHERRYADGSSLQGEEGVKRASEHVKLGLSMRPNLKIARARDEFGAATRGMTLFDNPLIQCRLAGEQNILNVAELFAGAGGMGLGFLLAGTKETAYRLVFSGEVNPVYVRTLNVNHEYMRTQCGALSDNQIPEEMTAVDLRNEKVLESVCERARRNGGVHILIGGPPCQGFSQANRNSWSSSNPHNRLVDTFLDYAVRLCPPVLVMENVQGIVWTRRDESTARHLSVAEHVVRRLARSGYHVYPKLLDAAWYGVPQHRNRFFLVGIHRDLGYSYDDFGEWGPFPLPTHGPGAPHAFVTVEDAIGDLPSLQNGAGAGEMSYVESIKPSGRSQFLEFVRSGSKTGVIWDHVTSRHAKYVIERYRRIPEGGNWEAVRDSMTNYADVERTHSNIYRRLRWTEPAITIGHYRKSMLVHPSQHRGLSLREAARLQSFPDWFRFAGSEAGLSGGLTHKQQQLANAVCPLVTKAVAEFLLGI